MLVWVLPIVGCVAFLFLVGSYNRRSVLRQWEFALGGALATRAEALGEHVALDHFLAERAHGKAVAARERADLERAAQLLAAAGDVIRKAVPDRLTRLKGMAVCARMVAAMVPMAPLLPREFQLRSLVTVSGIAAALHHVLVSMEERFRLRVWFLAVAYREVLRVSGRSTAAVAGGAEVPLAWSRFAAALADFRTLDREHVECFRALLLSLTATEALE